MSDTHTTSNPDFNSRVMVTWLTQPITARSRLQIRDPGPDPRSYESSCTQGERGCVRAGVVTSRSLVHSYLKHPSTVALVLPHAPCTLVCYARGGGTTGGLFAPAQQPADERVEVCGAFWWGARAEIELCLMICLLCGAFSYSPGTTGGWLS